MCFVGEKVIKCMIYPFCTGLIYKIPYTQNSHILFMKRYIQYLNICAFYGLETKKLNVI